MIAHATVFLMLQVAVIVLKLAGAPLSLAQTFIPLYVMVAWALIILVLFCISEGQWPWARK